MNPLLDNTLFSSFAELEERINEYAESNHIHLYKRDARRLDSAGAEKRSKSVQCANENLIYYSIKYSCIHGGRNFIRKKKLKNERETKTRKAGCPFFMLFTLTKDGQFLEMKSKNDDHNHIRSEKLYKMHPRERRLPEDAQKEVSNLLNLQANKKLVQAKVMAETGKNIFLKDLSNISAKFKEPDSNLEGLVNKLREKYNCLVNVLHENNEVLGIFFQDDKMLNAYNAYPEILFLDGTYKLTNRKFTCFVFLIEDGNGGSEIVGVGLLTKEDASSMEWLVLTFQANSNSWNKTRAIMTDKDLVERKVLSEKFIDAHLLICKFHVLRTFKREITPEKMGITAAECAFTKDLLERMCYAASEDDYFDLYQQFITSPSVPRPAIEYFNKNWHPIYKEWTHLAGLAGNFLNYTNNRLESINSKLKSVIKPNSSLSLFVDNFFVVLQSLRKIRDKDALDAILKTPVTDYTGSPLYEYSKVLLPFPFKYICKQHDSTQYVNITEESPLNFSYTSRGKLHPVNANACSCVSYSSMRLPCKHILKVKSLLGLPAYDEELIPARWTKDYFLKYERLFQTNVVETPAPEVQISVCSKVKPKSKQQKYRQAFTLATELADIASDSSGEEFKSKINILEQIINLWKSNSKVNIMSHPAMPINNTDHDYAVFPNRNENSTSSLPDEPIYALDSLLKQDNQNNVSTTIVTDSYLQMPCTSFVVEQDDVNITNIPHLNMQSTSPVDDQNIVSNATIAEQDTSIASMYHSSLPSVSTDNQNDVASAAVPDIIQSTSIVADQNSLNNVSITHIDMPSTSSVIPDYRNISLPPVIRKRGRSKGSDKTVIGLPRKRYATHLIPFKKLGIKVKQERMLKWFVDQSIVEQALQCGTHIDEDAIEVIPSRIPNSCLEECVNLDIIKEFFTEDAWKLVENVIKVKKQNITWKCKVCDSICLDEAVMCDACLEWIHTKCAGCKIDKRRNFFCKICKGKASC